VKDLVEKTIQQHVTTELANMFLLVIYTASSYSSVYLERFGVYLYDLFIARSSELRIGSIDELQPPPYLFRNNHIVNILKQTWSENLAVFTFEHIVANLWRTVSYIVVDEVEMIKRSGDVRG
jgi:hypothetical protein